MAGELHTAREILDLADGASLPGRSLAETAAMRRIVDWTLEFTTKPHPNLGRDGPVCPFTELSVERNLYYVALHDRGALDPAQLREALLAHHDTFLALEPDRGGNALLKTIVAVLPGMPGRELEGLQAELKPHFAHGGMMLGQLYPDCDDEGRHNPAFRPQRSPLPILVIRAMVLSDVMFLARPREYLQIYLTRFGAAGCQQVIGFLDRNRAYLPPEQAAMMLEVLAEFGPSYVPVEARIDALTGLYSKDHFLVRLRTEQSCSRDRRLPVALLAFAIDRFDGIDDRAPGSSSADRDLLREVARVAKGSVRQDDIVARLGPNEFAVLAPHMNPGPAWTLGESLRAAVAAHEFEREGATLAVTVSVGLAVERLGEESHTEQEKDLLGVARRALEAARLKGGNRLEGQTVQRYGTKKWPRELTSGSDDP